MSLQKKNKGLVGNEWIEELHSLTKELGGKSSPDLEWKNLESRHEMALHNVEVYQEELRAQNEELHIARESAEASLKKFHFLFENSPVGYFTIDSSRRIEEVNATGVQMLGIDRINLIEKPFFLYIAPESRKTLDSHFRSVFAGNRPSDEIWVQRKNDKNFPAIIESCPAPGETPNGGRCLTIIFDITERIKHEEEIQKAYQQLEGARTEAERASMAKSDFIATMSHELRTPLNAILGFSEVMKENLAKFDESQKFAEYSNAIFNSGQHLLLLVNNILDVSKIESGDLKIHPEPLDIKTIFDECITNLNGPAREKGVDVIIDLPALLPDLFADREAVLQMLFNLVSNAIKHTNTGGRVTLSAESGSEGGTKLIIFDTGIGIPPEKLNKITKPFSEAGNPYLAQRSGLGLGLAITNGLIQKHGGDIHFDSVVNKGTTVSLFFPSRFR